MSAHSVAPSIVTCITYAACSCMMFFERLDRVATISIGRLSGHDLSAPEKCLCLTGSLICLGFGMCSPPHQSEIATEENCPVWLIATTAINCFCLGPMPQTKSFIHDIYSSPLHRSHTLHHVTVRHTKRQRSPGSKHELCCMQHTQTQQASPPLPVRWNSKGNTSQHQDSCCL